MTTRIGPAYWQQPYYGPQDEVGSFFDSMADVIGAPPGYSPQPVYAPMVQRGYVPQPMPPMARYPQPPPAPVYGIPSQRIIPTIPGAPAIGVKLQPLGFGVITFTATSGTALPAITRPQKPFKGRRLVVDIARTGATATGLITVTSLTVGVNNQFVSTGAVGAGAFAATAFDCNVELSACSSALDITVNYATTLAPTAPDTISIGTTLFGESVGS